MTPSGTKIVHTVPDLAEYAEVAESELVPVLETLAAARILRPVDPAPGETDSAVRDLPRRPGARDPRLARCARAGAGGSRGGGAAADGTEAARGGREHNAAARRRLRRSRDLGAGPAERSAEAGGGGALSGTRGQRRVPARRRSRARTPARSRGCGRETHPGGRGCLAPRADVVAPACRRADPRPCPQRRDLTRRQPRAHRRRSGDCARAERNRRRRRHRFLRRRPRQRRGFRSDRPADRHGEQGRHRADRRRECEERSGW